MRCSQCRAVQTGDATTCSRCGAPLGDAAPARTVTATVFSEPTVAPAGAGIVPGTPVAPTGEPLSGVGKRLGANLLDGLLVIVTLFIGYVIWSIVIWSKGQTPAKQLLHMRTVKADTGETLTWGGMFVREVLVKGLLIGILSTITFGIVGLVAPLLILGGTMRQTMWDRIYGTLVVDGDPA